MSVAVTGARGFLGWHLRVRLLATRGAEASPIERSAWADERSLSRAIAGHEVVVHLAGVNRADTPQEVERGNIDLAKQLAAAVRANGSPVHLVYGSSTQARLDNPYGRGKARAAELLGAAVSDVGGSLHAVVLPNLFGEHGRPYYNSVVATFCHELAGGRRPLVHEDRELDLMHAQAAAEVLLQVADRREAGTSEPTGSACVVSELRERLTSISAAYGRGEIPDLSDDFTVDLFNTYRAASFPGAFPFRPLVHSDARGDLFETVRSHGGQGQSFVSMTRPGAVRGDHYHLRKVERFCVVSGDAEISLRRLLHDDVTTFRVGGGKPAFVDMPTLWTHNIRNVGSVELVTMFWASQLLDPVNPDQYPEPVVPPRDSVPS